MKLEELKRDIINSDEYYYHNTITLMDARNGERIGSTDTKQIDIICNDNGSVYLVVEYYDEEWNVVKWEVEIFSFHSINKLPVADYEITNMPKPEYTGGWGCYLTTACVEHLGKEDDCYELETLRDFRDTYIKNLSNGKEEVEEYYTVAPQIVESINKSSGKSSYLEDIYNKLVLPSIELINEKKFKKAFQLYKGYTLKLKKEFEIV